VITTLSPGAVAGALALRDLTDPAHGRHAVQLLLDAAVVAVRGRSTVSVQRWGAAVAVEDNYDRLGYAPSAVTRASRYSRYLSETVMLRSHTSAGVPPALRALAAHPDPPDDVLLVLPGLVHRRDAIDRMHVGEPHQVDLWRIVRGRRMAVADLQEVLAALVPAVLPGARWRTVAADHPYTEHGRQVDVDTGDGWVELAECGLAAPEVLRGAGLDPDRWSGLALGMGLDRALVLRKGLPDIRLLRAADPRVAGQMQDLAPWRPVSMLPPARRDLSIVVAAGTDTDLLGDRARTALGPDAQVLESLTIRSATPHERLPQGARARLGTRPGQENLLVRLILRPLDHTLTDHEANDVRDRVYAALHEGPHHEWSLPPRAAPQDAREPRDGTVTH
jgi:phenylalanyl-tRNA synthetase alpha chain